MFKAIEFFTDTLLVIQQFPVNLNSGIAIFIENKIVGQAQLEFPIFRKDPGGFANNLDGLIQVAGPLVNASLQDIWYGSAGRQNFPFTNPVQSVLIFSRFMTDLSQFPNIINLFPRL